MNAMHYKELFSFNNMHVQHEGGSELDGFDEYFGSSNRMEQKFVMMTKQKWLCLSYSERYENKMMMMMWRRLDC